MNQIGRNKQRYGNNVRRDSIEEETRKGNKSESETKNKSESECRENIAMQKAAHTNSPQHNQPTCKYTPYMTRERKKRNIHE